MTDNDDHNQTERRNEFSITIKELFAILVAVGSIVSVWISLSNSQVQNNTKLDGFEKYYRESLTEYKVSNERSISELKILIGEQKKSNNEVIKQVTSLEQSVMQLHRVVTTRK